jgi:hypothetical protein
VEHNAPAGQATMQLDHPAKADLQSNSVILQ